MVCGCMSPASTGELRFIEGTMNANMYCNILKQSIIPSLRDWVAEQYSNMMTTPHTSKTTTALLKKLRVKVICGASSNGRWRSARSLISTSSVMAKYWHFRPNWTFSLRGVLTFVASGLDINGCVLSYFEGAANLHDYTSCTLTTLHCSKVPFLQCCHMKIYNTIFTKMWGVYSLLWDTAYVNQPICLFCCFFGMPTNFFRNESWTMHSVNTDFRTQTTSVKPRKPGHHKITTKPHPPFRTW